MGGAVRQSVAAAVLGACLAAAPAASAQVTIGGERIVVPVNGGRAVIQRSPVRITFEDAAGRPVLRQVDPVAAPTPVPPTPEPEPGGLENVPDPRIYAPFAFEVGGQRDFQWYGGFWQGNMLVSGKAGVLHSAREVTAAEPDSGGVKLTVSTTDPTRTLSVTVAPDRGTGIRVRATVSNPSGVSAIGDAFHSSPGEAFRGFGGRHDELDQRGSAFYNWTEQENFGSGPFFPLSDNVPGFGGERYMAPNGMHAAYYPQSLFVSSNGYGFLLDGTPLSRWRMAADRDDAWQVSIGLAELDYTVALGDPPKAIETLTEINGRHRVPPDWAVGPTLSRAVFILGQGSDDAAQYQRKVTDDIKKIEELKLPVEAYVFESWAALEEDFVKRTNAKLRSLGIHPMGYMRSFLSPDRIIEPPEPYEEALAKGYMAKTPGGAPYYYPSGVSTTQAMVIDFTHPEVPGWWEKRIRKMLDLGFDGFMNDFGEQTLTDMQFHNGETGVTMHNRYPSLFHGITRDAVEAWERDNPKRGDVFFYTRAGFSGRPGTAAPESANFPGDETTDWNRATGLPSLAPDMLNRGIGGAVGFTTDIGGYIDSYVDNLDKELFVRWSQWAALSPLFRVHNSCCDQGQVMPWSYDAENLKLWREAAELHVRARPLIRSLWREAARTGMPIARPLWLHHPDDPEAVKQEQQWLLGPDVLVAPVVEKGARKRNVYFPRGCWQEATTGQRFDGPRSAEVDAALDRLPYFLRCGTEPFEAARQGGASCRDLIAPKSRFTRRTFRASRSRVAVAGRSSDRGCSAGPVRLPGKVKRVHISIAKVRGASTAAGCRFVGRDGRLEKSYRSCRRATFLSARGTTSWRFARRVRLEPGNYRLQVRARDARGNKERPAKPANLKFRIR